MAYGIALHVWGEYALFTRPETKSERMSYEVITPSAARGILEAIHWKPAIRWFIDKLHILNPVCFDSIRRNELACKGSAQNALQAMKKSGPLHIAVEDVRQQRAALVLRRVAYVIEAHFKLTDKAGPSDNEGKHLDIFNRRARTEQCFHRPCLGCREFPAHFSLLEGCLPPSQLTDDAPRDLGWMLYDLDFAHNMQPIFYRPRLVGGVIDVADCLRRSGEARP